MNIQNKAYCGDAIAQLAVGELIGDCSKIGGLLSNKAMAYAWVDFIKDENFDWGDSKSLKKAHYKVNGTKFEAMLYETFEKDGYKAAKSIVEKFLLPIKEKVDLSFV